MKKYLVIISVSLSFNCFCQLGLTVDSIHIHDGNIIIDQNEYNDGEGPWVYFFCSVTNYSDDTVRLFIENNRFNVTFDAIGETVTRNTVALNNRNSSRILDKNQSVNFEFGYYLLSTTKLLKRESFDYTEDLRIILHSICVKLITRNVELITCEMNGVVFYEN